MPETDFDAFERRLLDGGIAATHARRIADELAAHWQDLCEEARRCGLGGQVITAWANRRLGGEGEITAAVLEHPELKCWIYRHPHVAHVVLPLAYLSMLPAVPLVVGVQHAPLLARWGACLMLSALFTATLMLVLYLGILAS
jgi:hypothetical protein